MKSRIWLIILAAVIIGISIIFTNHLAASIAKEEHRKMETWAEATRQLLNDEYSDFIFNIIEQNENIPVIIVDDRDRYISARNFNEPKINVEQYYERQIQRLKSTNPPIEIVLDETTSQYIYYDNSNLLKMLEYFPYIQLSIIALFLMLVIWAISTDKRAAQDKLWAGLSKETAHQLGTPISSLMAWNEILKTKIGENDMIVSEIEKDVNRLHTITERFSKIGSIPELSALNISEVTAKSVEYMLHRTSKKNHIFHRRHHHTKNLSHLASPLRMGHRKSLQKCHRCHGGQRGNNRLRTLQPRRQSNHRNHRLRARYRT